MVRRLKELSDPTYILARGLPFNTLESGDFYRIIYGTTSYDYPYHWLPDLLDSLAVCLRLALNFEQPQMAAIRAKSYKQKDFPAKREPSSILRLSPGVTGAKFVRYNGCHVMSVVSIHKWAMDNLFMPVKYENRQFLSCVKRAQMVADGTHEIAIVLHVITFKVLSL